MLKVKKIIRYLISFFILFTFLASMFGFVYMESYNKSELAKYNSEEMNWKNFCLSQSPPGGVTFYKEIFPFCFTLIGVSAVLVLVMFGSVLLKTFFRAKRSFIELVVFITLILFAIWSFFFSLFFSIIPTLVTIILALLIFAQLKISSYDKYTIVISVFLVALSYFLLLGAWFDTDPQFYNCIGLFN